MRPIASDRFTLALGGGGARGWAHIGVARALDARGLRPARIVGTSMGAIVGAGLAAGRTPDEIEAAARESFFFRTVRSPGRFAIYDPTPLLERIARDLGDPRIEELPVPLGISAFDLVSGRPKLFTRGRLVAALARSIAVPFFFPPRRDAAGVWCDAGPWESVPVSLARRWDPELAVIGVHVDAAKPPLLSSGYGSWLLRRVAGRLGVDGEGLSARRYLALLAARWTDPVVVDPPDLLITPRLGLTTAWQFGRVGPMVERGERDTHAALESVRIGAEPPLVHAG